MLKILQTAVYRGPNIWARMPVIHYVVDIGELEAKGHFSASGHGIFNIRERANFINGQCEISSLKGKGTTISIQVPLDQ